MQFASQLRRWLCALATVAFLGSCFGYGAPTASLADRRAGTARTPAGRSASAAIAIAFSETAHLHPVSSRGSAISEEGRATGTYTCPITVHLVIVSAERVTATFTVRPKGGTVSGSGSARLEGEGGTGYFGGTLAISRGTGVFAHASGRGIGISGSFNRATFSATVHVDGTVHL